MLNSSIPRISYETKVNAAFRRAPIVALLGPRQCGKSTLARGLESRLFLDLESPRDAVRLEQPELVFSGDRGLIIVDEAQRNPELFPFLRYHVDRYPKTKILLLGSASEELINRSSESLAGRIEFVEMSPFHLDEVGADHWKKLWLRGSFPRSFLARSNKDSVIWRENFIRTFLERDLRILGIDGLKNLNRRFWTMLAHYHGQVLNVSELGQSFGISDKTARHYVEGLAMALMVLVLPPFEVNTGKRIIKRPKIYLRDSGVFHSLMDIESENGLLSHPKLGASFEGFALEMILRQLQISRRQCFFYGTSGGAEMDLVVQLPKGRFGFEFKSSTAPSRTKSMLSCQSDLKLKKIFVIAPTPEPYLLDRHIQVLPITEIGKGSLLAKTLRV